MAVQEPLVPHHQVFLNFRGEELRDGFVSYLETALKNAGINVFIDKNEMRGEDLTVLFRRIEESKIALVVFSRRYMESKWCLNELVNPIELEELFYDAREIHSNVQTHIMEKWKVALECIKSKMGLTLKEQSEADFVKEVVVEVMKRLSTIPCSMEGEEKVASLFGIEHRIKQVEEKFGFGYSDETRIVGIVGMPGIGKTTLATELFKRYQNKFIRCVNFLKIRKETDAGHLRMTFLKDLLPKTKTNITDKTTFFALGGFNPEMGDYMKMSRVFVDYVRGNPKALRELGKELCGKGETLWKARLNTLTTCSNKSIQDLLKISYDELSEEEKDAFLDIACFFRSEDEFYAREAYWIMGIMMMSPLKVPDTEIVTSVRGIFLDMSQVTDMPLYSWVFAKMCNLWYLKFYTSTCPRECEGDCKLNFPDGLSLPLEEIRYLDWLKFPLEELPSDFNPKNLVDLRLPYSKIKQVWKAYKDTPKLKWVDLNNSRKLQTLAGFSKAPNLLRLNLEGCTSLERLSEEMQTMESLVFLNLRGCTSLSHLPQMNLSSLKTLILSSCAKLYRFQLISENLESLYLDGTAIEDLPSDIVKLQRLVLLNLKECKRLRSLPECIGKLKALEELILSGCSNLETFPNVEDSMENFRVYYLMGLQS
ncbi:disease resistance-like protein CSA1 [Brassica napus]|uniref:disease resistance-like protein CSA1 n=1 Tax=Brassica napus TaxID=3708 RepID=UPI0020786487|nr:disease resistance-like protein CSA1 [Brassica napus]